MKKQIRNCSLLLLMAAALGGCAQEEFAKEATEESKPITLMASVGSDAPQTRIGFEDKGTAGIELNWSKDDVFTVYHKDGAIVGNFQLKSGEGTKHATFEAVGELDQLMKGDYVAVYPASSQPDYPDLRRTTCGLIESWNKMGQLSEMLHMEAEFAFDPDNTTELAFEHKYTMLTIVLNAPAAGSDGEPAKVSMHNSANNDFADIQLEATNWESTVYTMMQPSTGERKLTFAVTTSTGKVYTQTIETDKAHIAGQRYTATLNGLVEETKMVDLASFTSSAPTSNVWIISDSGSPTADKFAGLRAKLEEIQDSERKIELIFPNLITIPADVFYNTAKKSLQSVSAPKATEIKTWAFNGCKSLASIYFPNVKKIGSDAFTNCSLASCDFPAAETIEANAFYMNYSLTSVNLPVATSIANAVFRYCTKIKTMTIALNSTTIRCGNIFGDTKASNISLITNQYNGTDVSGDKKSWIVPNINGEGTIEIGPFKEEIDRRK